MFINPCNLKLIGRKRMHTKNSNLSLVLLLSIFILAVNLKLPIVAASLPLVVNVRTEKSTYHYRQMVTVYGNVTLEGDLVEDGLVAIQILNPNNVTLALRTVPANTTPSENWTVEITSFTSTDAGGNPKTQFNRNSFAYFKTRIKNNDLFLEKTVLLTITLCDIDSTPIKFHWLISAINPGATHEELVGLWIEDWVSFGNATAYASICTDWPKDEGYPYAPEKNTVFSIVTTQNQPSQTPINGYASYQAAFRLPPQAPLGTYTIRVSAYYRGYKDAYNIGLFYRQYELLGDIVYDRKIDIFDVVKASIAYGSQGGEPKWDPEADLDPNGSIDIFDVVIVTSKYGTTY